MVEQEKNPIMRLGLKLAGKRFFRNYPYEEMYFLEHARRIRERVSCGVCYIGGACTSDSLRTLMSEGFDFVELGRALLFDPDMPHHVEADTQYVNGCTHCNRCATLIEAPGGIQCVLRPSNFSTA
jgi:2,4-dienoyl-CoA reductase-like NADH-dependent reductase (Old Yellow Enzyme family)